MAMMSKDKHPKKIQAMKAEGCDPILGSARRIM